MRLVASRGDFSSFPLLVLVLMVALVVSGCFGGGDGPVRPGDPGDSEGDGTQEGDQADTTGSGNASSETEVPSVLVYEDCAVHGLQMRLPAEFFQSDLPPGFEIAPADPSGEMAVLEVVGLDCPTVLVNDTADEPITEFRFHLDVLPPAEHDDPEADRQMLLLDSIQSNPRIMELYHEWDLWSTPGSTSLDTTDLVAGRSGTTTVDTPFETFEVHSGVLSVAPSCQDEVRFRMFSLDGDEVSGYVDVTLDATCFLLGSGSVVFEPFGTDPEDLAFWLLITGATSGIAFHSQEDTFRATQVHTLVEDQ